jgi:Tol biopolymer transport system component
LPLQPGLRLGVYEIIAAIGAGGMGEVYRACDTKLNRDVAIKVLPDLFANDAERLARFMREARTLASLNHANIAAIYGVEESGGVCGLVMELVEGEDLSQRIAQGAVPLDEALAVASQIAEALAAAHEQGIVHRDLKPANVKVRPDGTVKVLDFGLAKAMESSAGPSPIVSQSPTLTTPAMMTGVGVILGTAAYMSPEQARGKAVDKRTDIWAFGCVLYEMLSGRRPFDAEDVSMTLASVMMKEPDWAALPEDVPPHVRTVVRRCLEKDRKRRLSDIAVAQFLINEPPAPIAIEAPPAPAVAAARESARAPFTRLAAAGAMSGLALAAAVGITWWLLRPAAPQPVRFLIVPPPAQPLTIHGFQRDIAITPDGRHIVYRVGPAGVVGTQLAVRSLDELDARILTGIAGIRSPFISPDGHWIGFFEGTAGGDLKKVSIQGGPPIALCKYVGNPLEASWGPDDRIIFATSDRSTGLLSVSAAGGEPKTLTKPDTAHGETDHLMPFVLPGGRAVLFTIVMQGQPIDSAQIAVLDLTTGQKRVLVRGGSDARYVDTGYLVYAAAGTLRAVRFDPKRLELAGDPVPLIENVTMSSITGTADFVLSQNGTLVYVPGGAVGGLGRSLAWVSRQGREEPIKAPQRLYAIPRISPDGTRVAFDIRDQENDIWVWDLKRETLARLTFDPGGDQFPVWTPDSRRIVFSSARDVVANLYSQAADNTGTIERLTRSPNAQLPLSISPDGSRLVFMEISPKTNQDIGMLTLGDAKNRVVSPLLQTMFTEANAEVSPNGRWMAYQSSESGTFQIYVRPFPNVDTGRWQISTSGGTRPLWARSGRELFYYDSGANALMVVAVQTTGPMFSAGNPIKLFDTAPYFWANNGRTYDVSADARFLMIKPASLSGQNSNAPPPSLVVVEHWMEELKARAGTK